MEEFHLRVTQMAEQTREQLQIEIKRFKSQKGKQTSELVGEFIQAQHDLA